MNDAELGKAIRHLVAAWIEWHSTVESSASGEEIAARVEGYRVVSGGQTGSDGSWEITDAASGEVLASGTDCWSGELDEAWRPEWHHIDNFVDAVVTEVDEPKAATFGLPPGFASAIEEFALNHPEESRWLIED